VLSVVAIVFAFALGAIPTAYLLGRLTAGIDVRRAGSGNPGALNAYRQLGKGAGLLVLLLDAGKGALAIVVGQRLGVSDIMLFVSAFAATFGHNFSPALRFRGGKGGAVVLGISAVMLWQITAITAGVGAVVFLATRHAVWSVAIVLLTLNGLTIGTGQGLGQIVLCLSLSALIVGTHVLRRYPDLVPALRARRWRRVMTIE
jgi:glycerol-3-phosphate acyltransferase PlsY